MGYRFEVNAWVEVARPVGFHGYQWEQVYAGHSFLRALMALREAKKLGGCAKLEWRS